MDKLEKLNRRFGNWYEGLFGGSDKAEMRPRDILRRLLAAMEDNRREGLDGRVYVPNVYTVQVAVASDEERDYLRSFLSAEELAQAVMRSVEQHGYGLRGPLVFTIEEAEPIPAVTFAGNPAPARPEKVRVRCRFDAQPTTAPGGGPSLSAPPPVPARPRENTPPVPAAVPASQILASPSDDDDLKTVPAMPATALASLAARDASGRLLDVYPLNVRGSQIGRSKQVGNDIVLESDTQVSKRHARVGFEQNRFVVYDENSTNGTYVNDEPLTPGAARVLESGDVIRLGNTTLLFRPSSSSAPSGLPAGTAQAGTANIARSYPVQNISPNTGRSVYRLVAGDGESFALASEMTVGRALTSDIALVGTGVSSSHARLSLRGEVVYIEDLNTPGGTFVNGERIPSQFPVALYDGDQVAFGEVLLRLEKGAGWASGSAYGAGANGWEAGQ